METPPRTAEAEDTPRAPSEMGDPRTPEIEPSVGDGGPLVSPEMGMAPCAIVPEGDTFAR